MKWWDHLSAPIHTYERGAEWKYAIQSPVSCACKLLCDDSKSQVLFPPYMIFVEISIMGPSLDGILLALLGIVDLLTRREGRTGRLF